MVAAAVPPSATAQQPTVSRALERVAGRDTVVAVWFFGREAYPLDALARAVEAVGGEVRRRSRWLHAVSANLPTRALDAARIRPEFRHLQPVAVFAGTPEPPVEPEVGPAAPPAVPPPRGVVDPATYGGGAMPMRRLNLFPLVDQGLRGAGVRIALLDTGFETELPAFDSVRLNNRIIAQRDFVFDDATVRNEPEDVSNASQHGTMVWSILAANIPNTLIGIAPDAEYLLAKTEDVRSETRAEEDNYVAALEWADSAGAHIISSSLGYLAFDNNVRPYGLSDLNGDVAVTTIAADIAAQRGVLVVASAGNCGNGGVYCLTSGLQSITTPADGDSVIAVGSEDSTGTIASSSSRGPTADGRIKPDLTAPGVAVFMATASGGFTRASGTSFSAPIIAGTATLIHQVHYPVLDNMEILEALRRTGTHRAAPDSSFGWGRPDGSASAIFPRGIVLLAPVDTSLGAVTPEFRWEVPNRPAFADPIAFNVVLARDSTFQTVVLDDTLTVTSVRLLTPQRPGDSIFVEITGTALDSVTYTERVAGPFVAPAWATLTVLNDPAGSAIRELQPEFRWVSPPVEAPPGPFTYDIRIIRDADDVLELEARGLDETTFQPARDLERNTPYRWEITAHLGSDSAVTASQGTFLILDDSAPVVTLLFQNFPNPFPSAATRTETTCIWFDLATQGRVTLDILDIRGHVVTNLIPGDDFPVLLSPGRYGRPDVGLAGRCDPRLEWDGGARNGTTMPRGIYLARLATPDGTFIKRIVFLGTGR